MTRIQKYTVGKWQWQGNIHVAGSERRRHVIEFCLALPFRRIVKPLKLLWMFNEEMGRWRFYLSLWTECDRCGSAAARRWMELCIVIVPLLCACNRREYRVDHTHSYAHTHTHTHKHTHTHTHARHTHKRAHTHTHTLLRTESYAHTHTHTHTHTLTLSQKQTHSYSHSLKQTHTHKAGLLQRLKHSPFSACPGPSPTNTHTTTCRRTHCLLQVCLFLWVRDTQSCLHFL